MVVGFRIIDHALNVAFEVREFVVLTSFKLALL